VLDVVLAQVFRGELHVARLEDFAPEVVDQPLVPRERWILALQHLRVRRIGHDGLLRTRGRVVPECDDSYPRFLTFSADVDTSAVSDLAHDFGCVAIVGTNGCGLEQQLEAVLKAVTPSTSPIRFFRDTVGHGDLENSGFLRPDSILAVVVVTDEDDCSIADASLADETSPRYTSEFDMRCIEYEREALHPIARYVDGLRQLRTAHPDRLVFAAITGVPEDLVSDPEAIDYDAILADPRMTPTPHPVLEGRLRPSCEVLGRGFATPPRRIVRVAREFGDAAIVQSICQSSFDGALRAITERLGSIVRRVGCGEEEGGGSGT